MTSTKRNLKYFLKEIKQGKQRHNSSRGNLKQSPEVLESSHSKKKMEDSQKIVCNRVLIVII